jgi:Circadian oscillating protein COP23
MKNLFESIAITLLFSQVLLIAPTLAGNKKVEKRLGVEFFCAPSQDNRLPTTQLIAPGMKEYLALIIWKYPAPAGITNRQRCQIVSNRFQNAWDRGSFDNLVAAQDENGMGLICAVSYRTNQCDRSNSLFTLSKFSDAQEVIDRLKQLMKGDIGSPPVPQSSGKRSIDFQQLLKKSTSSN